MRDNFGRPYARLSELRPGQLIQVDDGFEGCFLPWSILFVVEDTDGELALIHNDTECGACEGEAEGPCLHYLAGQLADDNDSLIGIYLAKMEPTP